ncbi:hepatitis A virus cellular receptor 1 isoform X3 [Diceros bicornis minor]|uniref:hepatitis A virus cellular receptor 1 isoform X3 n=1 Tax=Diceros bicornis minor TaxID=77932 RepID=UPI0026F32509|nr:hepatitis A virus cellular receptor 1 isoform X3 [Diceros bicornis minor]
MNPLVAISSLILLLTDAVVSYTQVSGVVGQPVTLLCTYSAANGAITTMCWGRGQCPMSQCSDEIIWTNGSHVTFQKHTRYKLKGKLLEGNVSLTIENAVQADSGLYCCRVEHKGWFNDMKLTLSLEIKPVATLSSPVQTAETQPTTLQETRTTSAPLLSCSADENGTVTQFSDGLWHNNQTHVLLAQNPWMITSKGLSVGISITAMVVLTFLVVMIAKKYLSMRNKQEQLSVVSFNDPQIGALQSAAELRVRAEDNIYVIEDNVYVMD